MPPLRLALFTLDALPNARAVRRLVVDHAADIAFVGLSNAGRPNVGGFVGQTWRHVRRSGPMILPYLAVNFGIPDAIVALRQLFTKLTGRAPTADRAALVTLCRDLGVAAIHIDDVNGAEVAAQFAASRPDLIVVFHFDQIFSAATLRLAPLGGINVHPSLLPRHRGPVPTIYARAEDNPAYGVTVHRLSERIDAGDILAQSSEDFVSDVSASGAAIHLHDRGRELLDDVLRAAATGGIPAGRPVATLPYCPFPSARMLWSMWIRGRRITRWGDVLAAFGHVPSRHRK